MSEERRETYRITNPRDQLWRIDWEGDLVDSHPAEKAENLFIELNRYASFGASSQVEIDLTHCGAINSAGLAFLIYLRRRFQGHGNRWVIANMPLMLHRMLGMLNLDSVFEVESRYTVDRDGGNRNGKSTLEQEAERGEPDLENDAQSVRGPGCEDANSTQAMLES
jgi:ABC-type transporter Mla MlaB component